MARIELLAHLLSGSATLRPDGVHMDDYAEGVVKQANRIADLVLGPSAPNKLTSGPPMSGAAEPPSQQPTPFDATHVERTRELLAENGFPSGDRRNAYQPGPGQTGRVELANGLIISFYRSGKTNFGGHDPGPSVRTNVITLLSADEWKGTNSVL